MDQVSLSLLTPILVHPNPNIPRRLRHNLNQGDGATGKLMLQHEQGTVSAAAGLRLDVFFGGLASRESASKHVEEGEEDGDADDGSQDPADGLEVVELGAGRSFSLV